MAESDKGKEVEEALGKPIFDEFPEQMVRIRRNLMIFAFLVIAYKINGLEVSSQISTLGFRFEGLTNRGVDLTMFCLVLYHLIHFFWSSLTHLQQWRLRVTGTKLAHRTTAKFASEYGDYPDDPRQSTLYTWWHEKARQIRNIGRDAEALKSEISSWENKISQLSDPTVKANLNSISTRLSRIEEIANDLKRAVDASTKVLDSKRIPVSLKRYDTWFMLFQWNQLLRWFLIEWLAPIGIGIWACWLSWPFIF